MRWLGGCGASSWLASLEELVTTAGGRVRARSIAGEAELLLEPVADELVVVRPIVRAAAGSAHRCPPPPSPRRRRCRAARVLLTQIAAIRALTAGA